MTYIVVSNVKKLAHAHNKRVGQDFLARLNHFVERKLAAALEVHNGGRKTLDAAVADYVLGKN